MPAPVDTVRTCWRERTDRPGWDTLYTHLDAQPPTPATAEAASPAATAPETAADAGADADQLRALHRLTGQAFVAVTPAPAGHSPTSNTTYLTTIVRKVLQRGPRPPLPAAVQATLDPLIAPLSITEQLTAAAVKRPVDLDPSLRLDPTYEQPLWTHTRTTHPQLSSYLTPQAPLDALTGSDDSAAGTRRFTDFLLYSPFLPRAAAIELDGGQHHGQHAVDNARDNALSRAGHAVLRIAGPATLNPGNDLHSRLAVTADRHPAPGSADAIRAVHAPAAAVRFLAAILELLDRCHLLPGAHWHLHVADLLDITADIAADMLALLAAVDQLWDTHVAPTSVTLHVNGAAPITLVREGLTFRTTTGTPDGTAAGPVSSALIELDPCTPPHAALPTPGPHPCVVIRGAFLPVELTWQPGLSRERRNLDPDEAAAGQALGMLLRDLLGHTQFRDGQREALLSTLAGDDQVVLLPTGAGKSAIYQLAGLLRPGITIVVDPIVSLIDDQERRLRESGITRVSALHRARIANADERDNVHEAIADGSSLFCFLTPERLQSTTFRAALAHAAQHQLINLTVVDEAHTVSEWGHAFRTAYLRLGQNLRRFGTSPGGNPPPLLALTGTASPAVLRDVIRELHGATDMLIRRPASFDRPNLSFTVLTGPAHSWPNRLHQALAVTIPDELGIDPDRLRTLNGPDTTAGLVFVPHVNGQYGLLAVAEKVSHALHPVPGRLAGGRLDVIDIYSGQAPKHHHSGPGGWPAHKSAAAARFTSNQSTALVTTNAFGMGIDKGNVRWTVHLGIPSSIEAFVQEAGRAGRDQRPAHCVIVATPPPHGRAQQLLDLATSRTQRLDAYQRGQHDDDLQRQLFFLTGTFTGIETEYKHAAALLPTLLAAGPGGRVELSRADTHAATTQEKALYRLALIGLVDDYTIDHGAGRCTVELTRYSTDVLDQAVTAFISRIEPGKLALRTAQIASAPTDLPGRAAHHLHLVLTSLYAVIEPARVRALAEMYQLATAGLDSAGIRARLQVYLTDGPMSALLSDIAQTPRLSVSAATALLDTAPAEDPTEWVGAAARQLELYPDHPVLLLVRALGEAFTAAADESLVISLLTDMFTALPDYSLDARQVSDLICWAATQLLEQADGRGHWAIPAVIGQYLASTPATAGRPHPATGSQRTNAATTDAVERLVIDAWAAGRLEDRYAHSALIRHLERVADLTSAATVALLDHPAATEGTS